MIRKELVEPTNPDLEYSFIGAIAIHKELEERGILPVPALATINRILKRHNLTGSRPGKKRVLPASYYPVLHALYPNHRHETDLVTPRYISGFGRVVSVNRIDVFSTEANLQINVAKGATTIIDFCVNDWTEYGIPEYLQLDNEAAFRGGMYHPRSFGKFIRFCLNFGVQIIFIPWKEPWRNPLIENFNGHFNRLLWNKKRFQNPDHMSREARRFLVRHNGYQRYRADRFSKRQSRGHTLRFFPKNFRFDAETSLPITPGRMHFVRRAGENASFEILNETFSVSREFSYEYLWTTVDTAKQTLSVYHQASKGQRRVLIKEQLYKLREPVRKSIPIKNFSGL